MSRIVYFNGKYLPQEQAVIPLEERGYNFADALYEVARVYGGCPFTLEEHFARMERGARILNLELGFSLAELDEVIRELVKVNEVPEAYAYFQVTRGQAPRAHAFPETYDPNFFVIVKPFEAISLEQRYAGVKAITYPDLRHQLCDVKTTALIPNVLARQAAVEAGAYEAILVRGRFVSEGSATSAYIVRDGMVKTHPLGNILPGITRSVIVDMVEEYNLSWREEPFTPDELYQADEAFITGSTLEIMPVVEVDGKQIGAGEAGTVTRQLIDYYIDRVERDCGQYWAS